MTTTLADIKKLYYTAEADVVAIPKQGWFAEDTRRQGIMHADGVTKSYFFDDTAMASQTFVSGASWIGVYGIAGVTPLGGSLAASGTAQAMMEGLANMSTAAATAVLLAPASSVRNVIQPTGDYVPISIKGSASQTANLTSWQTSAGVSLAYVDSLGRWVSSSSQAGVTVSVNAINGNNSNLASHAALGAQVGGGSGGDPYTYYSVSGGLTWVTGIDNSDSDKFKVSEGTALGTNDRLIFTSGGLVTVPGTLNVTGNFSINSTKLTIAGVSGDIVTLGNISASGNGIIGGNFNVNAAFTASGTALFTGVTSFANQVFNTMVGGGFWFDTAATVFTYGMYQTGTSLAFRSGSTTPFLVVTSAGLPTFANAVTMSSTLNVVSNFTVNTNKMIVDGPTGNTVIAGTVTLSNLTAGRIPVVSTAGLLINDSLYFDTINKRVGIGALASAPGSDLHVKTASTGGVGIKLEASDNTNTGAEARLYLITGGASGGDPFIRFDVSGATSWSLGVDNSVTGDPFVLSASGALGTTNALSIATSGAVTMLGALTVTGDLTINGTYVKVPIVVGTPGSPAQGMICYNSSSGHFVGYNGSAWVEFA
jgi:hypothetical protein